MNWRVYVCDTDAAHHLALDEALLEDARQGKSTLLFVEYRDPMLVLSHNQSPKDILSTEIPYTRCITPGGAMLCNENVLGFSIAVPKNADPVATHKHYGGCIYRALKELGVHDAVMGEQFYVKVKRQPRNLAIVGTSQRVENKAQLYHGVITLRPWNANYLQSILRLRTRGEVSEYEKIKELPALSQYATPDSLTSLAIHALSNEIVHVDEPLEVPTDLWARAKLIVEAVYVNEEWVNYGQHPNPNLSLKTLHEGLGFCLLGSEFTAASDPLSRE